MSRLDYIQEQVRKGMVKGLFSRFQDLDFDLDDEKYLTLAENNIMKYLFGYESEHGTTHIAAYCFKWHEYKNNKENLWIGKFLGHLLAACYSQDTWQKHIQEAKLYFDISNDDFLSMPMPFCLQIANNKEDGK